MQTIVYQLINEFIKKREEQKNPPQNVSERDDDWNVLPVFYPKVYKFSTFQPSIVPVSEENTAPILNNFRLSAR